MADKGLNEKARERKISGYRGQFREFPFSTHQDDEVEAVVRAAAGRLVLLYLPTYSPWLNPIEMLWRHFRRKVTHCEIFETVKLLIEASYNFFSRYDTKP